MYWTHRDRKRGMENREMKKQGNKK